MKNKGDLPLAYIEISKKNLIHNIEQFEKLADKKTKIIGVVKANAYGHGLREIVEILNPYVDYFQVNSLDELKILRTVTKKETFILGYVQGSDICTALKLASILSVFSIENLRKINAIAKKQNRKQKVHIAIDAHLGREGFLQNQLPKLFTEERTMKNIEITGMYAHFANIEDTKNFSHAQKQINEYREVCGIARKFGFTNLQTHISATSGLLAYEKNSGINPLVRIGIGLYGLWPSEYLKASSSNIRDFSLKPVLSWKTKIAQIKYLPKGATIGYGLTYKTKIETKVAIIPQGYSNGLDRKLSNTGEVLIGGAKCKILGRVMMNMMVVNISHLKNVKIEDEVVILGKQGRQEITAEHIAEKLGSINYEVVTRISSLLPRIII